MGTFLKLMFSTALQPKSISINLKAGLCPCRAVGLAKALVEVIYSDSPFLIQQLVGWWRAWPRLHFTISFHWAYCYGWPLQLMTYWRGLLLFTTRPLGVAAGGKWLLHETWNHLSNDRGGQGRKPVTSCSTLKSGGWASSPVVQHF